jgi:uncharacterized protein YjiS (DUF1127 family)
MSTRTEKFHSGLYAGEVLEGLRQQVREWFARRALKGKIAGERRQLASLSDAMLRDIGVNRGDAALEAARIDIPAARASHENRGPR